MQDRSRRGPAIPLHTRLIDSMSARRHLGGRRGPPPSVRRETPVPGHADLTRARSGDRGLLPHRLAARSPQIVAPGAVGIPSYPGFFKLLIAYSHYSLILCVWSGSRHELNVAERLPSVRVRGRRRGRFAVACGLRRGGALALHVDAATEVRTLGNRYARCGDVAVDRAVLPDGHLSSPLITTDFPMCTASFSGGRVVAPAG